MSEVQSSDWLRVGRKRNRRKGELKETEAGSRQDKEEGNRQESSSSLQLRPQNSSLK